jgi:tetratricopeptide (TPR) repeat protein
MKNDNDRNNLPETYQLIKDYNKKAGDCYKKREFDEARSWELKVIELQGENNPQNAFNYFRIARSYQQPGEIQNAIDNYNKVIESCKNVSPTLLTSEILQKVLSAYQRLISAHVQVGKHYQNRKHLADFKEQAEKHYNQAIALYSQAISLTENDPKQEQSFREKAASVYVARGDFYREVGQHDQAKAYFETAIQLSGDNPKRAGAYIQLGRVFHELGQYEDSKKSYEEAIKTEEANQNKPISAYVSLAGLYREYGYFELALDYYKKAIELSGPDHLNAGGAYHGRAFLHRELGELKEAWKDYEKAIEVNAKGASPKAFGPLCHLGNLYRGLEKFSDSESGSELGRIDLFDRAIDNYIKAIQLIGEDNPIVAAAYVDRGNLYRERAEYYKRENKLSEVEKDLTSARQDFETAICLNPFTPRGAGAYASLGLLILDQAEIIDDKVFKEVLGCFDKALALNPRDASIYLYRGELYCKVGKFDRAYEEFEDAIEKAKPKGKKALQWVVVEICLKLVEQERFEKAKKYLEIAFPNLAILKRPFLSEDTLDSQRKREWFNYIELAEDNHKRKEQEGKVKDLLIQQFSHTLGSSLQVQRELIEKSIKKRNYDRLSSVLNELNSINRNLGLLSLSARDANQLRAKIKDSLSNQGVSLKDILFESLVSAFEVIIVDYRQYRPVFERYLHEVSSKHYLREFNGLSESEKDHLLQSWKDGISGGKKEEDKQKIKATTWETLQERKKQTVDPEGPAAERLQGAGWQTILDTWLKDKLSNQFEKLVQRQNLEDLLKWIEAEFFKMDLDIPSRLCFKGTSKNS